MSTDSAKLVSELRMMLERALLAVTAYAPKYSDTPPDCRKLFDEGYALSKRAKDFLAAENDFDGEEVIRSADEIQEKVNDVLVWLSESYDRNDQDNDPMSIIACLGDDATEMLYENPEDERAINMFRAAHWIERHASDAGEAVAWMFMDNGHARICNLEPQNRHLVNAFPVYTHPAAPTAPASDTEFGEGCPVCLGVGGRYNYNGDSIKCTRCDGKGTIETGMAASDGGELAKSLRDWAEAPDAWQHYRLGIQKLMRQAAALAERGGKNG